VDKYPSIVIWVKEISGKSIPANLKTFSLWEKLEIESDQVYCDSAELKQQIKDLKSNIIDKDIQFIRIIGTSGVGKTRKVYEAIKLEMNT